MDWMKATRTQRIERRDRLAELGSTWADEDDCGKDLLPCGICDECVDEGVLGVECDEDEIDIRRWI